METKQELVNYIKQWLQMDDEIKQLQKQIKERRNIKKQLTQNLVTIMKDNSIDCFDITGGKLLYTQNKSKTPLSKKHLISSITEFFDGDQQMIKKLCSHIMNSRQQVIKENIKRKIL